MTEAARRLSHARRAATKRAVQAARQASDAAEEQLIEQEWTPEGWARLMGEREPEPNATTCELGLESSELNRAIRYGMV